MQFLTKKRYECIQASVQHSGATRYFLYYNETIYKKRDLRPSLLKDNTPSNLTLTKKLHVCFSVKFSYTLVELRDTLVTRISTQLE